MKDKKCTASPTALERLAFFNKLHGFHYDIHTGSEQAQALFDQVCS